MAVAKSIARAAALAQRALAKGGAGPGWSDMLARVGRNVAKREAVKPKDSLQLAEQFLAKEARKKATGSRLFGGDVELNRNIEFALGDVRNLRGQAESMRRQGMALAGPTKERLREVEDRLTSQLKRAKLGRSRAADLHKAYTGIAKRGTPGGDALRHGFRSEDPGGRLQYQALSNKDPRMARTGAHQQQIAGEEGVIRFSPTRMKELDLDTGIHEKAHWLDKVAAFRESQLNISPGDAEFIRVMNVLREASELVPWRPKGQFRRVASAAGAQQQKLKRTMTKEQLSRVRQAMEAGTQPPGRLMPRSEATKDWLGQVWRGEGPHAVPHGRQEAELLADLLTYLARPAGRKALPKQVQRMLKPDFPHLFD
jgi:hypothetical protein